MNISTLLCSHSEIYEVVFNLAIQNDNHNHKHKTGHKTVLIMTEKANIHIVTGLSSLPLRLTHNKTMGGIYFHIFYR